LSNHITVLGSGFAGCVVLSHSYVCQSVAEALVYLNMELLASLRSLGMGPGLLPQIALIYSVVFLFAHVSSYPVILL
jgi:hypothetical protein